MPAGALRLKAVLIATSHGRSGDADGNAFGEHNEIDVSVGCQKTAYWRFYRLRVIGERNGFVAGVKRGILAANCEYVGDVPFERVVIGDRFGHRAALIDN